MIGKIVLPLVPLRSTDSDRSEMTSQLLFGECVEILETHQKWLLVRNIADNYVGWVDRKMIQLTSDMPVENKGCVSVPIVACQACDDTQILFLPGGSKLDKTHDNKVVINNKRFAFNTKQLLFSEINSAQKLVLLAMQYLNAPYLWGGKSVFGIDCSGFTQVIYDMCGIQLPRDASLQVECGSVIDSIEHAEAADLAFFENAEGRIVHVGLMINSHQIIHASGWVKIENIDYNGIISEQSAEYTHKLCAIKRIL